MALFLDQGTNNGAAARMACAILSIAAKIAATSGSLAIAVPAEKISERIAPAAMAATAISTFRTMFGFSFRNFVTACSMSCPFAITSAMKSRICSPADLAAIGRSSGLRSGVFPPGKGTTLPPPPGAGAGVCPGEGAGEVEDQAPAWSTGRGAPATLDAAPFAAIAHAAFQILVLGTRLRDRARPSSGRRWARNAYASTPDWHHRRTTSIMLVGVGKTGTVREMSVGTSA